jgi:predicted nuclease of predicted toxin-antitoxin system
VILWLDAQLPPSLAAWLASNYDVSAVAVRDLGLRDAEDRAIFDEARRGHRQQGQ